MPEEPSGLRRVLPSDGRWHERWWPLLGVPLLAPMLAVGAAAVLAWYYVTASIPPPDELVPPEPSVVLASNGAPIATLDPSAIRENVDLAELPEHVWQAVLAAEDRRFYAHTGFSTRGVIRAAIENLRSGRIEEGGSTITQQYVELAIEDVPRTLRGKLREVSLALRLERRLSKDQILEHYLNAVPLGRGAIGIEAAARTYFGAPATELTVNQAATLAGMIAAPSRFDPKRNPEAADARRRYVLRGMEEQGWISPAEEARLLAAGLPQVAPDPVVQFGPNAAYIDVVQTIVAEELGDHRDIYTGLVIHTELNPGLQRVALDTLRSHLADTPYEGAVVTLDPRNGAVRALVGGRTPSSIGFNHAVAPAENQAGSAFKPFALAAFLAAGNSPYSEFPAPAEMEVDFEAYPDYEISNFGHAGFGEQTVREATLTSTNVVYVQVTAEVGPQRVADVAVAAGIERDDDLRRAVAPAIALGTADVTVLNMAQAYGTFANGGIRQEPLLVRRVETHDGEVLYDPQPRSSEALDREVALAVTDILQANIQRGTGTAARIGRPAAGKTGTTNEFRDAWFVGYVPQLATAVWIGNTDNTPMDGVTGGSIPATVWGDYMEQAVANLPVATFPEPDLDELEVLDEADDEEDEQEPTAEATSPTEAATTPEPSPTSTPSPPPPSPRPSPTPSPSPDGSPSPSDDTGLPVPSPSESDTGGDASPSPSDTDTGGDASPSPSDTDTGGDASPSPSDTDTGGDASPSPSDTDTGGDGTTASM